MKRLAPALIVFFSVSVVAHADVEFAAICEEPSGPRLDFWRGLDPNASVELKRSEDRYTGVNPFFMIDSADPKTLRYRWGHTKAFGEGLAELLPQTDKKAAIVIRTPDLVSAVEVHGTNRVSVFTLLPKLGFGAFTDHAYSAVLGEGLKAVTFTARCKFLR